jgi:hypothetical protein
MRPMLSMATLLFLAVIPALHADDENAPWRRLFDRVAGDYRLVPEGATEPLQLVDRAAYMWARSGPHEGTYGAVYVWTERGNAETVACFWRNPLSADQTRVMHELHSLSPTKLTSKEKYGTDWKPLSGLKRTQLEGAPTPAKTAVARMLQMRALCRDFTARSEGAGGDRTELRLLPQPLHRSQSTNPAVLDGALFAFVCSVGTDPEVFLQLEARNTPDGPQWFYTLARFSHMNLFVSFQDKPIWQALRDAENPIAYNKDRTYWVFSEPLDRAELESLKK